MRTYAICGILLAASAGIAAASGVNSTRWTPREMQAGARALAYPKAHPKKIACKGLGTAAPGNLYSSFKCKAVYRHNARRTFTMAAGTEGGWICAGRHVQGCKMLTHGFVGAGQVTRWGGLGAAAGYSAAGYVRQHYGGVPPQSSSPCAPIGGATTYSCSYTTPAATVTIAYKQVRGGWTVTGTG